MSDQPAQNNIPHRRRPRYAGTHPRRFDEKYKEQNPERYGATVSKVLASGKTPAGMHRPIMLREILEILRPHPGEVAVDCTLGYGGHARELLARLQPGGFLLGLDMDPIELPKTEARLRELGFNSGSFRTIRSNFAGLPQALATAGFSQADIILADLGVSSMQLDNPARGFSMKELGPLDMRMNPQRGQPVSSLLEKIPPEALAKLLSQNADEPKAGVLAKVLAGRHFSTTTALVKAIHNASPGSRDQATAQTVRRVFQALRIAVNDEFSALDSLLRNLPGCLGPDGRVAIITFHSGEDRRVKKAFESGLRDQLYSGIAEQVIRPTSDEIRSNPRSTSAKLRWAVRR